MLNAVKDDRRARFGHIEDALDPQDLLPVRVKKRRQPDTESRPVDRMRVAQDK